MNNYQQQAADFLTKYGIKLSAKLVNAKMPSWEGYKKDGPRKNNHFIVTLRKDGCRISFDYFDSENNFRAGVKELDAYSVLASCSGDYNCPDNFEDFCSEYGYDNDSRKAEKTFAACLKQSAKLKKIFSGKVAEDLMKIQ